MPHIWTAIRLSSVAGKQAASLVLTTTPAESLALGLRAALQPLRLLRVPVQASLALQRLFVAGPVLFWRCLSVEMWCRRSR